MLNETEEVLTEGGVSGEPIFYGPDTNLAIHFGAVPRASIPFKLLKSRDQERDLTEGRGEFQIIRSFKSMTNGEMYKFLRLGVSSQVAIAFKAFGYMTPESLQESPEISPLLPDALVRKDREYPIEFIDACERAGISALECQLTLRRGITKQHLGGALDVRQLMTVFNRTVPREGITINPNKQKTIVDFLVEGTIPIELIESGEWLRPEHVVAVVNYCLKEDEAFLAELNSDLPLFRKFVSKVHLGSKQGVDTLRELLNKYGAKVLDLRNPYLCMTLIHDEDGAKKRLGYDTAAFVEEAVSNEMGEYLLWGMKIRGEQIDFRGRAITLLDMEKMMLLGFSVSEFRQYVIKEGLTPQSVIAAREESITGPLIVGSL